MPINELVARQFTEVETVVSPQASVLAMTNSVIRFSRPPDQTIYQDQHECPIQIKTHEAVGIFDIQLSRTGNLDQRVGVVCYTESLPSHVGPLDYQPRPNNDSSKVYFERGERTTVCPVNITNDHINEPLEHFYVHLGEREGFADIRHDSSPVCVLIDHDNSDIPIVSFMKSSITVHEKSHRSTAEFILKREGDIRKISKVSCRIIESNATKNVDFVYDTSQEFIFNDNESTAVGTIEILPDLLKEGVEVVQLFLINYHDAQIGSPNRLDIYILDGIRDLYVKFDSDVYVVRENQKSLAQLPVYVHGDTTVKSNVTCQVDYDTADITDITLLSIGPQNLTGSDPVICALIVHDDKEWEGKEKLTVSLVASHTSTRLHLTEAVATVYINDLEDAPIVQFDKEVYSINEPLSNLEVDRAFVCLVVTCAGETCSNISVSYSIVAGTARESIGYEGILTERVHFSDESVRESLCIRILADHTSQYDAWFDVELDGNNNVTAVIGDIHRARVIIRNTLLTGVYFPDRPVIVSAVFEEHSRGEPLLIQQEFDLYHDLPLMCVTPCDTALIPNRTDHTSDCQRQQIDTSRTKYAWYVSHDGENFQELTFDTALTSTHASILESVYLEQGLYVRCHISAVDYSNVEGYSRSSEVMLLNRTFITTCSQHDTPLQALVTSYSEYSGRKEDFVMLDALVPHLPNTLPILSTRRPTRHIESILTSPSTRYGLSCSTLTSRDGTGLLPQVPSTETIVRQLKTHQFYRHYDSAACHWQFRVWLRVSTLAKDCGAIFTPDASNLTLPLHVLYVHIANDSVSVLSNASIEAYLSPLETRTDSHVQLPFDYKAGEELLVHPIMIDVDHILLEVTIFVYTYLKGTKVGILSMETSISGLAGIPRSPIYSSLANGTVEQAWYHTLALDNNTTSSSMELSFYGCRNGESCSNEQMLYSVEVPFSLQDAALNWHLSGWAQVNSSSIGLSHVIVAGVSLSPSSLVLGRGYNLGITSITACHTKNKHYTLTSCGETSSRYKKDTEIPVFNSQYNDSVTVTNVSSEELLIKFMLNQDLSDSNFWYLHITCTLTCEANPSYTSIQDIIIELPVTAEPIAATTTIEPSATIGITGPVVTSQSLPLYAMVLVLTALTIFVSVCSVTVVLFIYTMRQRWMFRREKRRAEEREKQELADKEAKKEAESRKPVHRYHRSRRAKLYQNRSTLQTLLHKVSELPTIEDKTNRSTSNSTAADNKNESSSSNSSMCMPKNRTLLAMMRPISCAPPNSETPKHDLSKKLTIEAQAIGTSNSKKGLSAGWYDRYQMRQKSLEAYAQLYLAAGANSPEPGVATTTTL